MQKIEGIILVTYPSRESDLVLKVLTLNMGKLTLYARAAKKSKKRFGTSIDHFEHLNLEYEEQGRSTMLTLKESSTVCSYPKLREDLGRLVCASLLCEVMERIIPENSPEPETIFYLLKSAFEEFEESSEYKQTLRICYEKLYLILMFAGLIDKEPETPSARKLFLLIELVEEQIQAHLKSKQSVYEIINSLKTD